MADFTTLVSTDGLSAHLDDPDWIVFDCRFSLKTPDGGRRLYLESHVPGARYADLDRDLSSPPTENSGRHPLPAPDELRARLRAWGVNNRSQVIVYDDTGGSIAGRMWWLLRRWLGHERTALLDGGFQKWCAEGNPLERGEVAPAAEGNFDGQPDDSAWVTTEELEQVRTRDDVVILDARPPERYRGEQENVDIESGHIPGSVNHFLRNNLDENGCFRSAAELREAYAGLHKPCAIHSCGSGVTACHNLLAMEIAGFPGSRLYVGSWSEWIRSPERPRAVGKEPG